MLSAAKERISVFAKKNTELEKHIVDLEEKLKSKDEENTSNRLQLSKLQEAILCQESEISALNDEGKCSQISIRKGEDERFGLKKEIQELQKRCEEMEKECLAATNSKQNDDDEITIEQLRNHLAEKDKEIYDLQENVAYTEKSVEDAHRRANTADEKAEVMQEGWNQDRIVLADYRKKYCEKKIECQTLVRQKESLQAQLDRSRTLNNFGSTPAVPLKWTKGGISTKETSAGPTVVKDNEREESADKDTADGETTEETTKEICVLELTDEGSCKSKRRKCKFSHSISPFMREENWKNSKLQEISMKLGKCMFQVVNLCPNGEDCELGHQENQARKQGGRTIDNHQREKPVCYSELEEPGSCRWGEERCRFSHDINPAMRENKEYKKGINEEKARKRSICANEFKKTGSCKKHINQKCPFRHEISEEERQNPEVQEKIEKIWKKMRNNGQSETINEDVTTRLLTMMVELLKNSKQTHP